MLFHHDIFMTTMFFSIPVLQWDNLCLYVM